MLRRLAERYAEALESGRTDVAAQLAVEIYEVLVIRYPSFWGTFKAMIMKVAEMYRIDLELPEEPPPGPELHRRIMEAVLETSVLDSSRDAKKARNVANRIITKALTACLDVYGITS